MEEARFWRNLHHKQSTIDPSLRRQELREQRLERQRQYNRERRARMSTKQRQQQLTGQRQYARDRRVTMSTKQKQQELGKNRATRNQTMHEEIVQQEIEQCMKMKHNQVPLSITR